MIARDQLPRKPSRRQALLRRVVAVSMTGTVVEWYEFFLYGAAATLVFSKVFSARGGTSSTPFWPPL